MDHLDTSQRGFRDGSPYSADALSTCFATSYAGVISFKVAATERSCVKAGNERKYG